MRTAVIKPEIYGLPKKRWKNPWLLLTIQVIRIQPPPKIL